MRMGFADPSPVTDIIFGYFTCKKCFPVSNLAGLNSLNALLVRKKMLEIIFFLLTGIKSVQEFAEMGFHDNPEVLDQA